MTGYNDITPRGGVAWDLFGTGKTSVKLNWQSISRRTERAVVARFAERTSDPATTRAWTDADSDFVPDCDLANPLAQSGDNRLIDSCAQISDLASAPSGSPAISIRSS